MKTSIRLFAILLVACVVQGKYTLAQEKAEALPNSNRLSVGISAGHYRYDPGTAIEFTSRAIFQNHLSLRIKGGIQWLEAYKAIHDQWISYQTFSTGLVYNGKLFDRTRFYVEFGFLGIVPDARFSDKSFVQGFYEFNGLEMTLLTRKDYTVCLYLGVGPAFIEASAEKIEGNPSYGNRVHYVSGFRVYLGK
jgi:hypothetical protein